ncbi:hypothetical protein IW136_005098 [Coemansia sp. RSA 678]|nr:hypothetical protein IW136_005098 [Coemansia sp. RSA 678]
MPEPQTPVRSESVSARASMATIDSSKIRRKNSVHSVGNFIIDKTLTNSLSSKVCLARHKKTKKPMVLKFIRLEGQNEKRLASYRNEVNNLALLNNPHISRLYDAVQTEKYAMLITEYAGRGDMLNYSREQGRMNEDEARRLFRQMISGVDYLHQNCIVHRNLKLENIMLDLDRNVKIIGFGHSSMFEWGKLLNTYCGSPFTCSPEMINGVEYTGPEVDIWSLGVVLYYMLTGKTPFQGEMLQDVYTKILKAEYNEPDFLSQKVRDLFAKIFVVDRTKRITMQEITEHPWTSWNCDKPIDNYLPPRPATVLKPNEVTLKNMIAFGYSAEETRESLTQSYKASTPAVCIYHLMEESRRRSAAKAEKPTAGKPTAEKPQTEGETKEKRDSQVVKVWQAIKHPASKVKQMFNKKVEA